jgi:hypothetical protein
MRDGGYAVRRHDGRTTYSRREDSPDHADDHDVTARAAHPVSVAPIAVAVVMAAHPHRVTASVRMLDDHFALTAREARDADGAE